MITDIIGGVTGGVDGNPLEVITDIIGGVTGGVGGDNPLGVVTDIIGGVTGGILVAVHLLFLQLLMLFKVASIFFKALKA